MKFRIFFIFVLIFSFGHQGVAQDFISENATSDLVQTDGQRAILMPGETIFMDVYRVPDMNGHYEIDSEGYALLPLLGKIAVKDQTPSEFARTLMVLYEKDYLRDPFIQVSRIDFSELNPTIDVNQVSDISELPEDSTLEDFTTDDSTTALELGEPEFGEVSAVVDTFLDTETLPSVETTQPDVVIFDEAIVFDEDNDTAIDNSDIQTNTEETAYEPQTVELLEGTQWLIEGDAQQMIQFLSGDDLAGVGPCNNFFGNYSQDNTALVIQFVAITINDCSDTVLGEEKLIKALEDTYSFEISPQDILMLLDDNNKALLTLSRRN